MRATNATRNVIIPIIVFKIYFTTYKGQNYLFLAYNSMSHILFFCTTRYFLGFVTFIFGAAVCYQETSTNKPQNDKKSSNMLILTF